MDLHEEALRWNRAFDALKPWQQFHPRSFWNMVEAVAEMLAVQPLTLPRSGETGTMNQCSADLKIAY